MESTNNSLMITKVESVQSTQVITEEVKILQNLNLKLQVKVHNLETELDRLKNEVQGYKGKNFIYDSLTKDLASLRKQFDKTAVALLKKCEAYDSLKKEVATLKAAKTKSPQGIATPIRPKPRLIPAGSNLKSRLSLYHDPIDLSSDDEGPPQNTKNGRPSMGSCGNIAKAIAAEEAMPSRLKAYANASAPLRNRVLIKLHSMKSASTESLESTGRKSLRNQEKEAKPAVKPKPSKSVIPAPAKKPKPNLDTSKGSVNGNLSAKSTPTYNYRPALGQSNRQKPRLVTVNNMATVKRSNSTNSNTSTRSNSTKPAFRL